MKKAEIRIDLSRAFIDAARHEVRSMQSRIAEEGSPFVEGGGKQNHDDPVHWHHHHRKPGARAILDGDAQRCPRFVAWSIMMTDKATVIRTAEHHFVVAHPDFWSKAHVEFINRGEKMPRIEDADADTFIAKRLRKLMREAWSESLRHTLRIYPDTGIFNMKGVT